MTTFNLTNLRTKVIVSMEIELEAIETGKRKLNVSNQFDDAVLQSAIQSCTAEKIAKVIADVTEVGVRMLSPMGWANWLSEYQPPEMDSCWID